MKDNGQCPYCNETFNVTEDMYGWEKKCPLCGKGPIDILRDPEHYIDTPFGALGIGSVGKNSLMMPILFWLLKRREEKKEKLINLKGVLGK